MSEPRCTCPPRGDPDGHLIDCGLRAQFAASPTPADSADLTEIADFDILSRHVELTYKQLIEDRISPRVSRAADFLYAAFRSRTAEFRSARTAAPGQVVVDREALQTLLDFGEPDGMASHVVREYRNAERALRAALSPDPSPETGDAK